MNKPKLQIIGRAEKVDFPKLGLKQVPAKIDTGADISSIWASSANEIDGQLHVILFAKDTSYYSGEVLVFSGKEYTITRVANSFGEKEFRYQVNLGIKVKGKLIKGSFTLADRSKKTYPILLGRRLLQNKFVVDVSKGAPLSKEERARKQQLSKEIEGIN